MEKNDQKKSLSATSKKGFKGFLSQTTLEQACQENSSTILCHREASSLKLAAEKVGQKW